MDLLFFDMTIKDMSFLDMSIFHQELSIYLEIPNDFRMYTVRHSNWPVFLNKMHQSIVRLQRRAIR